MARRIRSKFPSKNEGRHKPTFVFGAYFVFGISQLQPQPQEPSFVAFFEAQASLYGQPMHFLPLFLALMIYAKAAPMIRTITAMTMISASFIIITYQTLTVSALICLFFLMISAVKIVTMTRIIAQPRIGIQTEPKLPPVMRVPKKNTRKPME